MQFDMAGICVSTGSACHSVSAEGSAVLQAMKVPNAIAGGSIRFSLGRYNTIEDIETTLSALQEIVGSTNRQLAV